VLLHFVRLRQTKLKSPVHFYVSKTSFPPLRDLHLYPETRHINFNNTNAPRSAGLSPSSPLSSSSAPEVSLAGALGFSFFSLCFRSWSFAFGLSFASSWSLCFFPGPFAWAVRRKNVTKTLKQKNVLVHRNIKHFCISDRPRGRYVEKKLKPFWPALLDVGLADVPLCHCHPPRE
jgi:hypothetical protein